MMKYTWFIFMLAALLGFSFSSGKGSYSVGVPSALADNHDSKDSKDSVAKGEKEKDGKVTICHAPASDPSKQQTLTVDQAAVDAHMNHGDTMGACPPDEPAVSDCICPPGVASCVCPDGTPGRPDPAALSVPHNVRELYGH